MGRSVRPWKKEDKKLFKKLENEQKKQAEELKHKASKEKKK